MFTDMSHGKGIKQRNADNGQHVGTTQLTPPMIDITCERQQQTGSKCKCKDLTDLENRQANQQCQEVCTNCKVKHSSGSPRLRQGQGRRMRSSPWDPSPGKVCRAPPAAVRAQPRWRRRSGTLTRNQLMIPSLALCQANRKAGRHIRTA